MGARLTRGRTYARKGQVITIDVQKGEVTAKVQGTRAKPYEVRIQLNPISESEWDSVADAMASKAIFAAKLLSGEMPLDIEDAFRDANVALFPTSKGELKTDCSCPDWANPCKHIAAVYYLLAERFDEDPFLIFKLRGRTKEEIIDALREKRALTAEEEYEAITAVSITVEEVRPLEKCLDSFWQAGEALDSFSVNPAPPEVENAILKRLGDAPFYVAKVNLSSLLSKAYEMAAVRHCKRHPRNQKRNRELFFIDLSSLSLLSLALFHVSHVQIWLLVLYPAANNRGTKLKLLFLNVADYRR